MILSLEEVGAHCTGIVADIEVGVCRFSVDRCGFVGVYEDIHVRKRSIM